MNNWNSIDNHNRNISRRQLISRKSPSIVERKCEFIIKSQILASPSKAIKTGLKIGSAFKV